MRIMRKTCTTRRTSWNWSVAFLLVSNKNNDTKYGRIANRSITFRPPLKNFHLSGDALKRNTYSNVNHDIQTASTTAKSGLSCGVPFNSCCNDGSVFNVKATVDRTMNRIDITAIICWCGGMTFFSFKLFSIISFFYWKLFLFIDLINMLFLKQIELFFRKRIYRVCSRD